MKNHLTTTVAWIGIVGIIYSIAMLFFMEWNYTITVFILMLGIIVVFELLPIQMTSGESYSASSILVLFLAIYHGLDYAILAIIIGTFACFINMFKTAKFPVFPFIVTIGMYMLANVLAWIVWNTLSPLSMLIAAGIATFTYELVNIILLDAINKATSGEKMFSKFVEKLREMILPVLASMIVIPKLLLNNTTFGLIENMLYTLFFILVIIFFSRLLTQQVTLRRSTSQAFISILEKSISPALTGHGNRVALIIETLMDDFNYPKRKRDNLLQAAITHDIGKSVLPVEIFRKRGALTLSEEREYQTHPEKGIEIVKSMFTKGSFSEWILHHHERWDGSGFPKGLQGRQIPYESRLLALGNELDHILSRHDDNETILKLLKEKSGTILDPALVKIVSISHIDTIRSSIQSVSLEGKDRIGSPINYEEATVIDNHTNVGESFFIQFKCGQINSPKEGIPTEFIQSLVKTALARQESIHETCRYNNLAFDFYAQPHSNGEVTIFAHDLTPAVDYRKQLEQKILESYEEVINTLSGEKIKLHSSKSNLETQLGERISETLITKTADVPKSREAAKLILAKHPTNIKTMKVYLSITEAVTNVIKHATGGTFSIYRNGNTLQFLISDKGSGIPLHEIPKTILVTGYSSKLSLGQGFNMITKFSDHVDIHTSSEGTDILLEYKISEKSKTGKSDAS